MATLVATVLSTTLLSAPTESPTPTSTITLTLANPPTPTNLAAIATATGIQIVTQTITEPVDESFTWEDIFLLSLIAAIIFASGTTCCCERTNEAIIRSFENVPAYEIPLKVEKMIMDAKQSPGGKGTPRSRYKRITYVNDVQKMERTITIVEEMTNEPVKLVRQQVIPKKEEIDAGIRLGSWTPPEIEE